MTRQRALKQAVRARAAKTGERYTAARRHVLKELAASPGADAATRTPALPTPEPRSRTTAAAVNASTARVEATGAVSDAKTREKTGHGLDHWFEVLDRFGGVEKGHSALAKHLHADHGVDGWYSQGITVSYERARGARTLNQRVSGDYEVSVSKVVAADTRGVVQAFTNARRRAAWLRGIDPALARGLSKALSVPASKGFVVRADQQGRFRYKWGTTTVQMHLIPKPDGRTSVVVTTMKLPDAAAVEARRAEWRTVLASLAKGFDETR